VLSDLSVPAGPGLALDRWGQILGTGLGPLKVRSYRAEATKNPHLRVFYKPSDGLEPSTHSLPWRLKHSAAGGGFARAALSFPLLCAFPVLLSLVLEVP